MNDKDDVAAVLGLMELVGRAAHGHAAHTPALAAAVRLAQRNAYVNSPRYNIKADADFWLSARERRVDLACLPPPFQLIARVYTRPRQFPPGMFTLLDHPFLLSPNSKALVLRHELCMDMPHAAEMRVRRSDPANGALRYVTRGADDWDAPAHRALLHIPLRVVFEGEEGVDAGGLSSEFFELVCGQLFGERFGIFQYRERNRCYYPSKRPLLDQADVPLYYCFCGVMLGLALLNGSYVGCRLPDVFYKKLLGHAGDVADLRQLDEELYDSLQALLRYDGDDLEEALQQTFSVVEGDEVVDLLYDGRNTPVTSYNKNNYVELRADYELNRAVEQQFHHLRRGFLLVVDSNALELFTPDDLRQVLVGEEKLDFEQLRHCTRYEEPYNERHQVIVWFWDILLHEMTREQHVQFMKFVFGSAHAPAGGLGN